jgi:membrane-bound inhibitor of C-type lysozyme
MRAIRILVPPLLLAACASSHPMLPVPAPVIYACADGVHLRVRFTGDAAHVTLASGEELVLPPLPVGSGMRYGTVDIEFRGKGDDATLTLKDRKIVGCRAQP